jgi:hypothetical protein
MDLFHVTQMLRTKTLSANPDRDMSRGATVQDVTINEEDEEQHLSQDSLDDIMEQKKLRVNEDANNQDFARNSGNEIGEMNIKA